MKKALSLVALLLILAVGPAQANRYDLQLGKLVDDGCNISCAQPLFNGLMRELGLVLGPVFLSPAETLGLNGFAFGFEGSVVPINNNRDYWKAAEGNPGSVVFIPRMHVRKGLPFSFEIGTQMAYLPESELFNMGAEIKWALNEGFYFIPDLAVRLAINHTLGSKDFELTNGGWDVSLSKAFGVGGMVSLTPYVGYNMFFVHASSHVVLDNTSARNQVVFASVDWQDNMMHRFFAGLRLITNVFEITAEGLFSDQKLHIFSFRLGFDY